MARVVLGWVLRGVRFELLFWVVVEFLFWVVSVVLVEMDFFGKLFKELVGAKAFFTLIELLSILGLLVA